MSIKWHIEKRNVASISEWDKNPRKLIKKKLEDLKKSISKFGMCEPIVINTNGSICGGHGRKKALIELKVKDVDCYVPNRALTDKEFEELNIRLNANIAGEFDNKLLSEYFKKDELIDWGIDNIDFIMPETSEDDFEIPETIKTDIKLGDMFQIGNHRLLCGDSTKKEDVERLMNGEKADMVFTDPPYRMEAQGGSNQPIGRAAAKLGKAIEHLCEFDPVAFLNTLTIVFESQKMNSYIFCNKDLVPDYLNWAIESGYSFNILFWKKPNAIPLGEQHRPDTEYLLFFRKSAIWNNGLKDVNYSKCLEFERDNSIPHPTMKPIELISNEIKISSNKNGIVFDFFLGSGSTMVASHQLKRKCYGIEISPEYCQIIIDRMKKAFPLLKIKKL